VRDGKYIFLPEDPACPQFFLKEKVIGVTVFADDAEADS
jgi:hypothetical protein